MTTNDEFLEQLREVFHTDLEQQIQVITDSLLALEKGLKAKKRQEALDAIMRAAHNVKGAARGVGADAIVDIAHAIETPFSTLKEANRAPPPETVDLCLQALDAMGAALDAFLAGEAAVAPEDLIGRLEAAHQDSGGATAPAPGKAARESAPSADGKTAGSPAGGDAKPEAAAPRASGGGVPSEAVRPVSDVVHLNVEKLDRVVAVVENLQIAKIEMDDHAAQMQKLRNQVEHFTKMWSLLGRNDRRHRLPQELRQLYQDSIEAVSNLNRVTTSVHHGLRSTIGSFGLELTSLQSDIRMLRLVPADMLLKPLARSVRDIARQLNKAVSLKVSGDDIEMDRAVLDMLRDPLVHLLRNAIDHGIEPPEERARLGKPAEGTIEIAVNREGGQIVMVVRDDGAGFDVEEIAKTAVRNGVATDAEIADMARDEILDLTFRPGFSTSRILSDVSGRGVGLDVVRTNMASIKGAVAIDSSAGTGTTFTLRMPLTLVTEHGLMLVAGGQNFVIPITSVDRVLDIRGDDIVDIEASQTVMLGEQPVPLHMLADALKLENGTTERRDSFPVVVVSDGWNSVALGVDEVLGEREIVVKPLTPPLIAVPNVSGGTLTGSGGVVMVLNPRDLVSSALRAGGGVRLAGTAAEDADRAPTRILVVDDSLTSRTLEKSVLENSGYDVTVAVNGKEAWERVRNEEFNLLVTDVEMPEMDGIELTKRIKTSDKHGKLPVIIVSSHGEEADKQRGIDVGADAYIVKSQFESKALLDVVRQLV